MYNFDEIRKRFPSAQGLSENQIVERLASASGVPYEQVAAQFGITKDTSSGFFGGAQDVVIEAANAAAGLVGSASEFVSPGNRFNRAIQENIIEPGRARQTVPTQLAKQNLARGLESSEFGPQARAVYDYVTENPLLAFGQAAGSFAPIGLPIRGMQAAATGLGLGAKGAARTGLATGSVVSGAAAGGDAAGSAYELVMNTPREVLLAHPQAQELINSGVTDEAAIYEELATRAARRASVVPAAIGAVSGVVGAESALVSPVRGMRGVGRKVGGEFVTEGLEEGATTYSGRAAAQEYNPAIDPMAGVAGSALLGGVMGAGVTAPIALARMERTAQEGTDLTQPDTAPAQEAPAAQAPVAEEAPTSPILSAARTLADFDPYAEIEARAAAGRPMSEAEATQFLSSTLAAQRAGQQFMDLMQQQQEAAGRIGQVGEQYQRMVGQRGDQILRAQEAGELAQPIVSGLERDLTAQEAPFIAAQQAGAGTQQLPGMVAGAGTVADFRRIMDPNVMQPIETQEFQPVERSALLPQQPAPFSNIRMDRPGPAPTPAPSSLLTDRPAEPVTPPGATEAVAAALPAAPVAAGVSSTATTGAPSGTQASQAKQAKTQGQKPPAVRIASTQTAEQQTQDELGLTSALQVANRTKATGNPLEAKVEGAGKVSVSGKTSLNVKSLRDIRDALLNPSATVEGIGDKEQRIADAVREFAKAYYKFSNAGGNMLRGVALEAPVKGEDGKALRDEEGNVVYKPTKLAGQTQAQQRGQIKAKTGIRVEKTTELLDKTRAALSELGTAVGGNAKDVEAIVKMVKDMVQKKLHMQVNDTGINEDFGQKTTEREDGKDPTDIAFGKLDTMLSQGWNAAKANMFQGASDNKFVRQTAIRNSAEASAAGESQSPLEKAAKGYAVFGKGESSDGLLGVMNYIQTHGTPFERTIAKAVFESMAYQEQPKLVFITEGKPRFDPKTNTVYIQRDASAAVALHEALHSALQWYVYQNPDASEVRALKAALKKVVNFKGPLNADAKRVQDLLKALVKGKKEIDAVLELVSYGNTLNDFRRALEAMDSTEAPKSFFDAASNVWQSILTAVQKMLGVKPTVASDVIANTFKLLEAAGQRGLKKGKPVGNALEAAVTAGTAVPSKEADAINQQFQNPLTSEQYKKLSTTLLPKQISSKFLFDMFGWAKVPGMAEGTSRKISDYIQKNHPGAAKVASWVNSHFGLQSGVREALIRAKDDRRGGSMIYNQIAQYFTSLPPQESVAVLEYMDAKLANLRKQGPAPVFPNNDTQMKDLADATITKWWEYARALRDPKQRDAYAGIESENGSWSGGVKFSQGLAFAESVDKLASASFGVRNISQLISSRTKNEVTADAITCRTDANGDAILDDKFVGMYLLTPALKKRLDNTKTTAEASQILAELQPDEFISAAKLTTDGKPMMNAEGVQLIPDRNYLWDVQEKDKGGYKFTARLDAKQALLVKKGRDLGHALQNTMAILANSYSANRLTEALAQYETKTPNAVAFNTLDDLNAMLNGEYKGDKFVPNTEAASWTTRVKQNQVVKLSANEAKSETVKGLYRNRNQWVQLPNGPTYGALAGKIVNGSVWSAIEDMSDRRPLVNSAMYNGTMRWFKKAKTIYNPATWGTNVASNFTMAMMDDIPLPTIGYATKLYVGYMLPPAMASKLGISLTREQQQLMLEIMKTNALLGDFSSTELKQSIYDSMRSTIGDKEQGVAERIMQLAKLEKDRIEAIKKYAGKGADAAERADQLLGDWYSMQDNIFRVASMLNNLGQQSQAGKPIDAEAYRRAGDHARFAFLDYDIDSKAVRIMRQTAFPFISWPYAAAKMIGNVAVHKPWKLVNLYAGLWILDGLTQAITGDDDDELRESGPEWARNRLLFGMGPHTHIRVPFMGDSENPVYYDIGKYITPSSFGDRVPNAFLGLSWWPSFITPGGPYISSAIALIGGVDPYNGRPLSPPTADDWEKLSARLAYGQSLFAPNLPFLNARELAKAQEAFTATEGRSENYSSLYMARTAGLRLYDFNVQGALDAQDRAAAAIEREYKIEIGKLKRKMERLETPDWDAFYEREEELVKRMEERIAKVRGGKTEEE